MLNKYYNLLQRTAVITGITGVLLIGASIPFTGCTYDSDATQEQTQVLTTSAAETIEQDVLDKSIEAHGGLETWRSFGTLEYTIEKRGRTEQHLIDLHSRRTLQTGESFQIGYNGTDVWVSPNLEAYGGNPRFANGLDFYFFSIPFVLADPGTNREYLGRVLIDEQEYEALKISYDAGVGASPNDYYIIHLDPTTFELKILLYTATFRSQEPSENYNVRAYEEWTEVDGLLLPTKMVSYSWDAKYQQLGEKRGEAVISDIKLSTENPAPSVFAVPEGAEKAP